MRKLFTNWWTVTIAGALIAAAILAVGLPPFLAILRPIGVRVALVGLVMVVWGLAAALRAMRARKATAAIAAGLTVAGAADAESQALAARMTTAMKMLKGAGGGSGGGYLYTRPWYVIIGPPGAGKTTALLNSGLHFPVGDQSLKGVGGTRNLDFWFADEAAMVDTAGRYTTQDSDATVDARGWNSFLALLKRHRPLQPINGVIVAIGVDDLLRGDRASIDGHAGAVRQRLVELRRTLGVAAPVYVILTKADLLAGFTDYYDDLDVEGRRAVLGTTILWAAGPPDAATLARAFDAMAEGIAARQTKRIAEQPDAARRALILGFPAQVQALRARLLRFLDGAFVGGEQGGQLRGFYLTSGVQEGTPIDQIMAGMADVYDRPQQAAGKQGRAYFLSRLLTEVMFPEAGLVTADAGARGRQRARLAAAIAGLAVLCLVMVGAWGVSYARNRSFQNDLAARAGGTLAAMRGAGIDLNTVAGSGDDLRAALPALDAMRDLPHGYADRQAGGAPLMMRLGLFQTGLSGEAEESYREALRRIMLPRLLLRLETMLKAAGQDPSRLDQALKVYLMLGDRAPLDKAAVTALFAADWESQGYPPDDRQRLGRHLATLLDDPDLASAWPDRQAPLDGALVAGARRSTAGPAAP